MRYFSNNLELWLQKHAKGSILLECVFQHLELIEKDYFGLQFTENGATPSPSTNFICVSNSITQSDSRFFVSMSVFKIRATGPWSAC